MKMPSATRTAAACLAAAFGPIDPFKHARKAGGMTMTAVIAAQALQRGDTDYALKVLRDGLEQYDSIWALHVWPEAAELDQAA